MTLERLKVEFRSPQEEASSIRFQLALLEEAGVHELLPQLEEEVALRASRSRTSVQVEARVANPIILRNRFTLGEEDRDLAIPNGKNPHFLSFTDELAATVEVRTTEGPFIRASFYYDLGFVTEFDRVRKRDEVLTSPTSYQAIVIETSPSRVMRVYHHAYRRTLQAVGGKRIESDDYFVDGDNSFVFPYYTEVESRTGDDLGPLVIRGGWSTQDSPDIGIYDRIPPVLSLKVPNAALYLLSQHPPLHVGK